MTTLVTGGGGFLGRYIVERLLQRGDRVRVFARGRYPELSAAGVDVQRGDLCDPTAAGSACTGIDTVFHVAALAGLWGRRSDFFEVNVSGTRNLLAGCRQHGVRRFVYTSSPSVVFGMRDLEGVDERCPYPQRFYAHYPASKAAAEQLVLAANGAGGLATCALRPHLIWGPRDVHIVPLLLERARSGQLVQIGAGRNRVDVSYVENAADAHLAAADRLALESPVAGQAYFIGDAAPVNLWDWVNDLLQRAGLPTVQRRLSYPAAYAIGCALEALHTVIPGLGEPRLTRFIAAQFAQSHWFDHGKAARDFGYHPRISNEEGLRRTLAWLHTTDLLQPAGDG